MQKEKWAAIPEFIAETNVFIAIASAFSAGVATWMYDEPASVPLLSAIFFATLFTYNFQRRIGDLDGSGSYIKSKQALMLVALAGLVPCLFFLALNVLLVLGLAGFLSLGYAWPVLPWKGVKISLRQVPYAKAWIIALVWMLACVAAPALQAGKPIGYDENLSLLFLLIQQGSLIFALTLCFDIRDLPYDAPAQRTIPMIFGVDGALNIARIATSVSIFAAVGNFFLGYFSATVVIAHFLVVFLVRILLKKVSTQNKPLFYTIILDGVLVVQGFAMFLIWWLG